MFPTDTISSVGEWGLQLSTTWTNPAHVSGNGLVCITKNNVTYTNDMYYTDGTIASDGGFVWTAYTGSIDNDISVWQSTALSHDGSTVVGVASHLAGAYVVYVYQRSGTSYTQQQSMVSLDVTAYGSPVPPPGVSISGDGNTIVLTYADYRNYTVPNTTYVDGAGLITVYTRTGSTWNTIGVEYFAKDFVDIASKPPNYRWGASKALLSHDGSRIVIGADGDNGKQFVLRKSGSVYVLEQTLDGVGQLGTSNNTINNNGDVIVTTSRGYQVDDTPVGCAYVWTRSGNTWTNTSTITPVGTVSSISSCAISPDSSTLILTPSTGSTAGVYTNTSPGIYTFLQDFDAGNTTGHTEVSNAPVSFTKYNDVFTRPDTFYTTTTIR